LGRPQARCCTHHQASDPFRHQENDREQYEPVEEGAELREGGDEFGNGRQDHRAGKRADDAAAAAYNNADKEEESPVSKTKVSSVI
jgi:hypothetical protein